jgi:hypothetical protein
VEGDGAGERCITQALRLLKNLFIVRDTMESRFLLCLNMLKAVLLYSPYTLIGISDFN